MNKTLVPYNRTGKAKSNRIGVDKGFESSLYTIDNIYRKPYANRRFVYHWLQIFIILSYSMVLQLGLRIGFYRDYNMSWCHFVVHLLFRMFIKVPFLLVNSQRIWLRRSSWKPVTSPSSSPSSWPTVKVRISSSHSFNISLSFVLPAEKTVTFLRLPKPTKKVCTSLFRRIARYDSLLQPQGKYFFCQKSVQTFPVLWLNKGFNKDIENW